VLSDLEKQLGKAISHFWRTREDQRSRQGQTTGAKDYGSRSAVTGGKQLDGFLELMRQLLTEVGLPDHTIYTRSGSTALPGYFRATKDWDLLVVHNNALIASLEFKSQVGPSFGNNFNNRTEEAIGSATDLWTAYREGAFGQSPRPWLGYFMMLEQAPRSTSPVSTTSPHFPVLSEFNGASYATRYEILCLKLVRERLYDSACLLLTTRTDGTKGKYAEPNPELGARRFLSSLLSHARTIAELR